MVFVKTKHKFSRISTHTDNTRLLFSEINASAPLQVELKHLKSLGRLLGEGKLRRNKRGLAEPFAIGLYGGGPKHFYYQLISDDAKTSTEHPTDLP